LNREKRKSAKFFFLCKGEHFLRALRNFAARKIKNA